MKKLTRIMLSLIVGMAAMFGMATLAYGDDVSKATEINEVVVDDLANVKGDNWPTELSFVKELSSAEEVVKYYKFTLDSPSRVYIKSFINVVPEAWMGGYSWYMSTSGVFTEKLFDGNTNGNVGEKILYLEKGTYYLKFKGSIVERAQESFLSDAQGYIGIYQEKMKRSGSTTGASMKDAIALNNGKYGNFVSYGVCNDAVECQWYKIVVNSKSDLKFVADFSKSSGYLNLDLRLCNSAGTVIRQTHNYWTLDNVTLERGTYYLQVDSFGCDGQIQLTTSIKDVYPPEAPTVRTYKSGTKKVIGKAEAGSTVYVKIGRKTYKGKAAANGSYSVTVPALKVGNTITVYCADQSNNKSNSTVVKVKNSKLSTPKVTKYKKGTKVVKGTAKKGTTVYVKYNGKTYKAKVSSNGKYSVKTAKLVRKKVIQVQIKDAYNNTSSVKKVKVK